MRSDRTLKYYYRLINRKFFNGELTDKVCVRYSDADDTDMREDCDYASCDLASDSRHEYEILINRALHPGPRNLITTACLSSIAHECIHIATKLRDDHGPVFENWRCVLAARGLFKKGAIRKNVTLF